ncbi:MAG: protein rep [Methylococcales bacterium]|nr:protein rep [Methylococcales bacterium]
MIHTTKEGAVFQIGLDVDSLSVFKRVERYGKAKKNNLELVEYLEELMLVDEVRFGHANPFVEKIYDRMERCASWLTFRHYYDHNKNRLTSANFCGKHLLCQPCAIRRGAQKLKAYHGKIEHVLKENPKLKAYLLTFTVKNGDNLMERFEHLQKSIQLLFQRRKKYLKSPGQRMFTEFSKVKGSVFSYETPKSKDGETWHPHCHMLVLCENPPEMGFVDVETGKGTGLRSEWFGITGDSFMLDIRRNEGQDLIGMCMEVMKYAVKFSCQEPEDTWKCFQVLNHRRLFGSMGNMWGVKVPISMLDEKLDGPYVEYMFRYLSGGHYTQISKVDMSEHYDDASSSL